MAEGLPTLVYFLPTQRREMLTEGPTAGEARTLTDSQ